MLSQDKIQALTAFIEGKTAFERYGNNYGQHNPYKETFQSLNFVKGAIHSLRVQEGYKDSINV